MRELHVVLIQPIGKIMIYQNILVAIDLSLSAHFVVQQAATLAQQVGAMLSVVHVIEHSVAGYGGEFTMPIDVNIEQVIEKKAREILEKLAETHQIPLERQHVFSGSVRDGVIKLIDQLSIDLIVVGHHSLYGINRLLGSRANAILHHATCDVLSVHVQES